MRYKWVTQKGGLGKGKEMRSLEMYLGGSFRGDFKVIAGLVSIPEQLERKDHGGQYVERH